MDKVEYHVVIKYFVLKDLTLIEIKNELNLILNQSSPLFSTIKKWTVEFKCNRTFINDDECSDRPKIVTINEIIEKNL